MGRSLFYEDYRDALACPTCFFEKNNHNLSHFHSAIELIYITKGSLCATISGKQVTAHEGELLVIPCSEIHMFHRKEYVEDIVLMIPLNYIPTFEQLFSVKTFVDYVLKGEIVGKIYTYIQQLADCQPNPQSPIIRGYTYLILGYVVQYMPMKEKQINDKLLIHSVVSYIEHHYTEPITIRSLAETFKYTESRMSHFFNEMMGCSFPDYIGQMRTKKAMFLLLYEKYSVTDAAMEAGFESLRTFYRVFKKNCGMTPLQYQKSLEQQEMAAFRRGVMFSGTYNGNGYVIKAKTEPVSAAFAPPFFWFIKGTVVNTGFEIDLGKTLSTTYGICRQFLFGAKMLNCYLTGTMEADNDVTTVLAGTSSNATIENMYAYVTITGEPPGENTGVSIKGTNIVNHYYYVENGCVKRYEGERAVTAEDLATLAPVLTANGAGLRESGIAFCTWSTEEGLPVMDHNGGYTAPKQASQVHAGTVDDPYLIATAEDFVKMQTEMRNGETFEGKYFLQTADICLNDCKSYKPLAPAGDVL